MGDAIGGIMKGFQGPPDQGIKPVETGGGANFVPTAGAGGGVPDVGSAQMPPSPGAGGAAPPSDDGLKRLSSQLQFANGIAGMGRGLYGDLAQGPGRSPLAAPARGTGVPYQPSARPGAGGMRLSDLLAQRR